jgi:hypothetical protein
MLHSREYLIVEYLRNVILTYSAQADSIPQYFALLKEAFSNKYSRNLAHSSSGNHPSLGLRLVWEQELQQFYQ